MSLRQKILLLATVPLILAISAISLFVTYQTQSLSQDVIKGFERNLLLSKKSELINYLSLAETSIKHIYNNARPDDEVAQEQVKRILNALTYGADGYFFVYDDQGTNLVHPKQTNRVGHNWWKLTDSTGNLVIQGLIGRAKEGGGFHRYLWEKPSTGKIADKIGYAIYLDKWKWMVGTGLYIDDVVNEVAGMKADISARFTETSIIVLAITFMSLVLVFISSVLINLHEMRLADEKLKKLTQRIVETQEEERGRVSRELHDGISQLLVSVKYALEFASHGSHGLDEKTQKAIQKGSLGLNQAISEVRRISRDLRPSILDDLGLSPAIESLVSEFAERTGVDAEVKTVAFRNLLPSDAKTTLYRVAQEALTNIERHSKATKLSVSLSAPAGCVTLKISDNGGGFDMKELEKPKSKVTSIGLKNMQERLDYLNGTFIINSTKEGTTIVAKLPKGLLETHPENKK